MSKEVKIQEIVDMATSILKRKELPDDEVLVVVAHLLDCELRGKASHGFYRLPSIVRALSNNQGPVSPITVQRETPASALVDGGAHLALVVVDQAMDIAIGKARETGIGVVGARNYIGTSGTMGYYARKAAANELVGIAVCNSGYAVAPTGGRRAILGTNPIAVAIPGADQPIVADLATSAWSYGELALAMRENRRIPEGVVIDKAGRPSTDPHDADNGAQLPMAGHKGYALGLAIELLAGPLVGAKAGRGESVPGSDGFLCIVMDPATFVGGTEFEQQTSAFASELKASPLAPNSSGIFLPGEQSERVKARNVAVGTVHVNESVLQEMQALLA